MRIFRKQNYRNVELALQHRDGEGQVVGIWQPDGPKYTKWLGVISRAEAKKIGKPVRLMISQIDSYHFPENEYVHGCYTSMGVYMIVDIPLVSVKD